ncbi:hypothetical protein ACFQX6_67570 [Streptosporangium lutulentum]
MDYTNGAFELPQTTWDGMSEADGRGDRRKPVITQGLTCSSPGERMKP